MVASRDQIQQMTAELQECLRAGEYLDALDICEEIEALGGMQVGHWLAMARCLMELRRKADAKRAWINALELEPDQPEAVEGLNRNFPGWRRQAARPAAPPAAAAERPARPTAPPPRPAAAPAPPRPAPQVPPEQALSSARVSSAAPERMAPTAPRAATHVPASPAPPSGPAHSHDGPVNWDYVLEDVAEAAAERPSR